MTTRITVTAETKSPLEGSTYISVAIDGDGGVEHFLDVFRASMIAAGFLASTAEKLTIKEDE